MKTSKHTSDSIGKLVRRTRKALRATQKDLALTSGTGLRFIIELEQGKPTCQFEKVLTVLNTLGIGITLIPPATDIEETSANEQGT
jgi:y4mF family transcriptional regulator